MLASQHKRAGAFDAVVIVGSMGSLQACYSILADLPAGFPTPIVIDIHRARDNGLVEKFLAAHTALPVRPAHAGNELVAGTVYVAPAERQLLLTDRRLLTVIDGPDGAYGHASANPLLSSAARAFGARLIAVVLTGRLDGGAKGVSAVRAAGGRVLVQDPATAVAAGMPSAALATGCVDLALPVESIGPGLLAFCSVPGAADLFASATSATAAAPAG